MCLGGWQDGLAVGTKSQYPSQGFWVYLAGLEGEPAEAAVSDTVKSIYEAVALSLGVTAVRYIIFLQK